MEQAALVGCNIRNTQPRKIYKARASLMRGPFFVQSEYLLFKYHQHLAFFNGVANVHFYGLYHRIGRGL